MKFYKQARGTGNAAPFLFPKKQDDPFYFTAKWQRLRRRILKRDGYMCQLSKRYGIIKKAEVVHHCFPLEEYPEYAFEPWNLISLSLSRHNALHDRNTNALTEEGRQLLVRVARKEGIEIPEKYQ